MFVVCVTAIVFQTRFVPTESAGADWITDIADRAPLASYAEDGTPYNSNLPDLTEGWW